MIAGLPVATKVIVLVLEVPVTGLNATDSRNVVEATLKTTGPLTPADSAADAAANVL